MFFLFLLFFLLALCAGIALVSLYFFNQVFTRQPKTFLDNSVDLQSNQEFTDEDGNEAWMSQQQFERLEVISFDGLLLRGYYLPAAQKTTKTAIIAHGYSGEALRGMSSFARLYHQKLGYNVLLPDARGHGESAGNFICFGWLERRDYVKWMHLLLQKVGPEAEIVLHGVSMGGATVLMTGGEDLPAQVKAIVSDCAYTSVMGMVAHQTKRLFHIPPFPLAYVVSLVCKIRAGFFFAEASALRQVGKCRLPVLFIHGEADTFVPTPMVYELHAAHSGPKELLVVPSAGHGLSYAVDGPGYEQTVTGFLRKFV